MPSPEEFFIRAFPVAGCMIIAAYFIGVTRERYRRLNKGFSYSENVEDAKLYSFMSKSGEKIDINNWEMKRVYRKEEDTSRET
ncbi:hypothetical protein ACTXT7_001958 [Hymenolepis weldensis]